MFKSLLINVLMWGFLAVLVCLWSPPSGDDTDGGTYLDEIYFQVGIIPLEDVCLSEKNRSLGS